MTAKYAWSWKDLERQPAAKVEASARTYGDFRKGWERADEVRRAADAAGAVRADILFGLGPDDFDRVRHALVGEGTDKRLISQARPGTGTARDWWPVRLPCIRRDPVGDRVARAIQRQMDRPGRPL